MPPVLKKVDYHQKRQRDGFEEVLIGPHRLICGDCREIIPKFAKGSINCVVTSPPYNTLSSIVPNPSGMWGNKSGGLGFVQAIVENGYSDDVDEDVYQDDQRNLFDKIAEICTADASLFYNHQMRWRDKCCLHPVAWFILSNWQLRQEIIWARGGGMMMNARMFCRFHESILWFTKDKWKWNQESVGYGSFWKIPPLRTPSGKLHPVEFPLEIPNRCISATTDFNDIVLDPYMGSGTTGFACVQLGRKFIGIEKEPKYFDVACRRIDDAVKEANSSAMRSLFGV